MLGLPQIAPLPQSRPMDSGMAAPVPAAGGGLGQRIGGALNTPAGGNLLSALGYSLMSSPRNAPLQNFGQFHTNLTANTLQQQRYDREEQELARKRQLEDQERQALVTAAKSLGLSEVEAAQLAVNPTALKLRLEQIADDRARSDRAEWVSGLPSLYGEGLTDTTRADPGAAPTDIQSPAGGLATSGVENLMRQRAQYVQRLASAPDEASRKMLEGYIGQIDKMIDMQGSTDTQKNLDYRAREAGLIPGTTEYRQFMMTGGAGATSLTVTPDGTVQFNQGHTKPLTEGQSKDAVYATRAEGSLEVLNTYGNSLANPFERAAEYDPTGIIRGRQSPEFQQARQAGDEFLQAILRKDTGAAITKEEMASYGQTYLPMPGDGPEVLAQKEVSRRRALEALKAGMSPEAILQQEDALRRSGSTPLSQNSPAATKGSRPRARNPQTGELLEFDGQQWVAPR